MNETNELIKQALERLGNLDDSKLISQEEFDKRFGFSDKDLQGFEKVEFE